MRQPVIDPRLPHSWFYCSMGLGSGGGLQVHDPNIDREGARLGLRNTQIRRDGGTFPGNCKDLRSSLPLVHEASPSLCFSMVISLGLISLWICIQRTGYKG